MGNCLCSNEVSRQLFIKYDLYIPNDDCTSNEEKHSPSKDDNTRMKNFIRLRSSKNSNQGNSTLNPSSAISTEIFMKARSKHGMYSADLTEVANTSRRKTIDKKYIPKLGELVERSSIDETKDINMLDVNYKEYKNDKHSSNNYNNKTFLRNKTTLEESQSENIMNSQSKKNETNRHDSINYNSTIQIFVNETNNINFKSNYNKSSNFTNSNIFNNVQIQNTQTEIIETVPNENMIESKTEILIPSSTFEQPKVSNNLSNRYNDEFYDISTNNGIQVCRTKLDDLQSVPNNVTKEEEKQLIIILFSHFLFRNFPNDTIKTVIHSLHLIQMNKGLIVFNEGEIANAFYIIKSGTVRVTQNETQNNKLIKKGQTFGEIALISSTSYRKYRATAETDLYLYYLNKEDFLNLINDQFYKLFPESFEYLSQSIYFFNLISENEKKEMIELGFVESYPKAQTRVQWNCNSVNKKAIFVSKGKIKITNKINNSVTDSYSKGNCFLLSNLFFQNNTQLNCHIITSIENTELIFIYEKMLIEIFGINYQKYLIMKCMNKIIEQDRFLMKFRKNCKITDALLLSFFSIKNYHKNESVIQKGLDTSRQIYILINGSIISSKNSQNVYAKPFSLFKTDLLLTSIEFDDDLMTSRDMWMLKTDLNTIKNILIKNNMNISYLNIIYNLMNKFPIVANLDLETKIRIGSHIKIRTFQKGQIILEQNTKINHFYFIVNGTVKITNKHNQKIRIMEEGNTFDEIALLNESPLDYNYITKSDIVVVYMITQEYFIKLLEEREVNEYIRKKALMESYSISLNDLFYLSYLGRGRFGNVCLVHNEIDLYAIKAISKQFAEKQKIGVKYLLYEKQTLCSIDHPFILKMVKTLKNENWIFFLMEYIRGINLNEYLDSRKIKKNIYETKFYAACLFLAIQYLHQKKIVHRDIKPSNIMVDKTGYLKLIDFGTAKKLKLNEKTTTVIGTPNFIAPEVLGGKGYSFSADFWSIGVCLYYIFYGALPFGNNSIEIIETYKEILNKEVEFPEKNNNEINSLISVLLEKNEKRRNCDLKNLKTHVLFCDFNWEDLIQYKIKAPFIPAKDPRNNEENLQNKNMPFVYFMDNEKCDTKQTVTLKCSKKNLNMKESNSNSPDKKLPNPQFKIPDNWFDNF